MSIVCCVNLLSLPVYWWCHFGNHWPFNSIWNEFWARESFGIDLIRRRKTTQNVIKLKHIFWWNEWKIKRNAERASERERENKIEFFLCKSNQALNHNGAHMKHRAFSFKYATRNTTRLKWMNYIWLKISCIVFKAQINQLIPTFGFGVEDRE